MSVNLTFINDVSDDYTNIFTQYILDLTFARELPFVFKVTAGKNKISDQILPKVPCKRLDKTLQEVAKIPDWDRFNKYVHPIYYVNSIHYADWVSMRKGEAIKERKGVAQYNLISKESWRAWELFETLPLVELGRPVNALFLSNNIAIASIEIYILFRRIHGKRYKDDQYTYFDFQDYLSGGMTKSDEKAINKMKEVYGMNYWNVDSDICSTNYQTEQKYDMIAFEVAFMQTGKTMSAEEHLVDEVKNLTYNFTVIKFIINNLKEGGSMYVTNRELSTKMTAQIFFLLSKCFANSYLIKLESSGSSTHWKGFVGIGFQCPGEEFYAGIDMIHDKMMKLHKRCACKTDLTPSSKFANSIVQIKDGGEYYSKIKLMNSIILNGMNMTMANIITLADKVGAMSPESQEQYLTNLDEYIKFNTAEWFRKYELPVKFKYSKRDMKHSLLQDMFSQINPLTFTYSARPSAGAGAGRQTEESRRTEPYEEMERSYSEYLLYQGIIDGLDQERWSKIKYDVNLLVGLKKTLQRYTKDYVPSQAFLKFYEILFNFKLLPRDKKVIRTMHICEAPGNFILSTEFYVKKNLKGAELDWHAQSLNPEHPDNIAKFGKDIFGNVYHLMERNPDRWVWGADGTGDITNPTNIESYRELTAGVDLISSDCGLAKEAGEFAFIEEKMLRTNLAQILFILSNLPAGGSYVFKAYLPFKLPFNVSLLYILFMHTKSLNIFKPSLNPGSTEVYVVGKGYRGVNQELIGRLMALLAKPEQLEAYEEIVPVPMEFLYQHEKMIDTFLTNNKSFIIKKLYVYENPTVLKDVGLDLAKERQRAEREWIRYYHFG